MNDKPNKNEDVGEVARTPLVIHRQYLKDLSFENPNAPGILQRIDNRPKMDLNIGIDVQKLESDEHENYYEVLLKIQANAIREDEAMFLAEVTYGGAASIVGLEEKQHHPLLFVQVPQMLFPFARQILASVTQSGSFMPLQIAPVDFRSMYYQRFGEAENSQNNSEDKQQKAS